MVLCLALLLTACAGVGNRLTSGATKDPKEPSTGRNGTKPAPEQAGRGPGVRGGAGRASASWSSPRSRGPRWRAAARSAARAAHHRGGVRRLPPPSRSPRSRRSPSGAALGKRFCEPAYRRVVGGTLADRATSILTWTLFTPSQAQLERGARWVRCDVLARGGTEADRRSRRPHHCSAQGVPEQLRVCQDEQGRDISCSIPHAYRVDGGLPGGRRRLPRHHDVHRPARAPAARS